MKHNKLVAIILGCFIFPLTHASEAKSLPPAIAFTLSSEQKVWKEGRWTLTEIVGRHYQTQLYVYRLSCDGFTDWCSFSEKQQNQHVLSFFVARLEFLADGIERGLLNAVELGASASEVDFSSGLGLLKGAAFGNTTFGSIRGADFRRYSREISTSLKNK